MTYREKAAWLTLGAMVVAYGAYVALLGIDLREGPPPVPRMLLLFGTIALAQFVVVVCVGALLQANATQREPDERDRGIARRGSHVAYYVLMMGMILVGVVMPFSEPGWKIVNTALLALVFAEAARHGAIVIAYRRGWHG